MKAKRRTHYFTLNVPVCSTISNPYELTRKEIDKFSEIVKARGMDKAKFVGFLIKDIIKKAEKEKLEPRLL